MPVDLTATLDLLPCAAVLLSDGRITLANAALARLLGRTPAELVGRPWADLCTTTADGEPQLLRAAGPPVPVVTASAAVAGGDLVTLLEVTSLAAARDEVREHLRYVSQLSDTAFTQAIELKRQGEWLENRVRQRTVELHEANVDAIHMMAVASEAKDADTGAHVRRIRTLSTTLARKLGFSEIEADDIGLAAVLHDVGKMHVPDRVLQKPGPLNDEERNLMRGHTVWGERILSDRPFFTRARRVARSHHENYDGAGYPDGLTRHAIPVEARIVHVADVYDALVTARVYKPAWPIEKARAELEKNAGTQFDPEIVRVFLT